MNIFFLDRNPRQAAQWLHDVHCRSQINESTQLLSGWAKDYQGPLDEELHPSFQKEGYDDEAFNPPGPWVGVQNPNHPCATWLLQGLGNVNWLVTHLEEIIRQYDLRYGNKDLAKYKNGRLAVEELRPWLNKFMMLNWTAPAQAYGENRDDYYVGPSTDEAVIGYRRYYAKEKFPGNTWKSPGQKPQWEEFKPPVKKSAAGLVIGKPKIEPVIIKTSKIATLKIKRK